MNKNYKDDIVIFVSFFILSFVCLIIADLVGHNAAGAYIGPITLEEIDWTQNSRASLIAALISTLALHKSKKNND